VRTIIAAFIIAAGLMGAAWIHAYGTRYEMCAKEGVLLDRKTGTMFILHADGHWRPLVTFSDEQ